MGPAPVTVNAGVSLVPPNPTWSLIRKAKNDFGRMFGPRDSCSMESSSWSCHRKEAVSVNFQEGDRKKSSGAGTYMSTGGEFTRWKRKSVVLGNPKKVPPTNRKRKEFSEGGSSGRKRMS